MSVEKKSQTARETFTPQVPEIEESEMTSHFMTNKHFDKSKTYLKGKEQKEIDLMSYRNVNVGGVQMRIHKDVCLTKDQLKNFNSKAKEFWLTERKGAALPKDVDKTILDKAKDAIGLGDK